MFAQPSGWCRTFAVSVSLQMQDAYLQPSQFAHRPNLENRCKSAKLKAIEVMNDGPIAGCRHFWPLPARLDSLDLDTAATRGPA